MMEAEMIEMRWLETETGRRMEGESLHISFKRTLQYRYATNVFELGLQHPIWSEWIDVPTVKEQP